MNRTDYLIALRATVNQFAALLEHADSDALCELADHCLNVGQADDVHERIQRAHNATYSAIRATLDGRKARGEL